MASLDQPLRIATINGSPVAASRTGLVLRALTAAIGQHVPVSVAELEAATLLGLPLAASHRDLPREAELVLESLPTADLIVAGTPVYKGSYTGLFKHLIDLLDEDALAGARVLLAATGGSARHTLVIEHQLRPLFGFFQADVFPAGLYASGSDFADGRIVGEELLSRIDRVAAAVVARWLAPVAG